MNAALTVGDGPRQTFKTNALGNAQGVGSRSRVRLRGGGALQLDQHGVYGKMLDVETIEQETGTWQMASTRIGVWTSARRTVCKEREITMKKLSVVIPAKD
jgi:hypothetical protein